MELWITWIKAVMNLRPACSRTRTFLWMLTCLAGMTIRVDLFGVTSFIRALHLHEYCYDRVLDFMHSSAINLETLTQLWVKLALQIFPQPLILNDRIVLVADGIKIPKAGRKMPAVKSLHQESTDNNKAEYIMGHSCQAIGMLVSAGKSFFSVPLITRIHEGLVFSNRSQKTLLDKMLALIDELNISKPFYLVADAYYANQKMLKGLLEKNQHLVSRLKSNAVAYLLPPASVGKPRRGRPKKYGKKVKLKNIFKKESEFLIVESPVYGEKNVFLKY